MPVTINPIPISGPWCQGWALDLHTLSSVFIGDDSFGNPQFDNKRSEIGELLYQFKYRGDRADIGMTVDQPLPLRFQEGVGGGGSRSMVGPRRRYQPAGFALE